MWVRANWDRDRMTTDAKHHKGRKRINLALQGGGAHGAFTWGVLERLMSDDRLFIDGLSGTSAGAMNAVVFTDGFVRGRQKGAIAALHEFWRRVSDGALLPMAITKILAPLRDGGTRLFPTDSPTPLAVTLLRNILLNMSISDARRNRPDIKLFVAATNVRTCKLKVFRTPEITVDSLLASACLPILFRAVEI